MRLSKIILFRQLIFVFLVPSGLFAVVAPPPEIRYSVAVTNSLGDRGIVVSLLGESLDTDLKFRLLHYQSFHLKKAGEPPLAAGLFNAEDERSLGSKSGSYWLAGAVVTEKEEAISVVDTIRRIGAASAYVPRPFSDASNGILFYSPDQYISEPWKIETTGSLANKDLVLTLRGKSQSYSFNWEYVGTPQWHRLPKPVDPPKADAPPTIGDEMKVQLCSQQRIGTSYQPHCLVTVLLEEPIPGKGRRKAYYYFVNTDSNDSELKYLDYHMADDDKPVGSGTVGDEAAAKPDATYTSEVKNPLEAKITLKIGSEVTQYVNTFYLAPPEVMFGFHWVKAK